MLLALWLSLSFSAGLLDYMRRFSYLLIWQGITLILNAVFHCDIFDELQWSAYVTVLICVYLKEEVVRCVIALVIA